MVTRVALIAKMQQIKGIQPGIFDAYDEATRLTMYYPNYKERYDKLIFGLVSYLEHMNRCSALLALGELGQETTEVYYQVFCGVLNSYHGLVELNKELSKVRALNKLI
jgi:hypothetical protein